MQPSYGPQGALFNSKQGNPTCPLSDLLGFYRDYLMDRPTTTSVGQADGGIDWYDSAQEAGGAWLDQRPGERWDCACQPAWILGLPHASAMPLVPPACLPAQPWSARLDASRPSAASNFAIQLIWVAC